MKELFIKAHEELIADYLDRHPLASWNIAYDQTADAAYDRMVDKLCDEVDYLRMKKRESYANGRTK